MNLIFRAFFDQECNRLLDPRTVFKAWLMVESALAETQAELEIIPADAAKAIVRAASNLSGNLDLDRYVNRVAEARHPLVPVLQELMAESGDAGRYVHFGATSQDITDTGLILWCRPVFDLIEKGLNDLHRVCLELAVRHRATVMVGRTHGQHGVPTTFGLRAAVWADQWCDHLARAREVRHRLFVGSFGGASGTAAGYGARAIELRDRMMQRLGLGVSCVSWHSAYERLSEYAAMLGLIAATADRIAREVYLLSRPEIGELSEPFEAKMVGSSTMPHKQNPIVCELVSAASAFVQSQVPLAQRMVSQRDDRDLAATFLAMEIIPESSVWSYGSLSALRHVLTGLGVHEARMMENLSCTSGLFISERIMLRLAPLIGRSAATALVKDCIAIAKDKNMLFAEVLGSTEEVTKHLSREEMEELLDPATYTGKASEMIECVANMRAVKQPDVGNGVE